MNIVEIIYQTLSANTAITDIVGTNIWPVKRHESGDAITYQEIDDIPDHVVSGADGDRRCRWQVNCWTSNYDTTNTLANLIENTLESFSGAGIDHIFMIDRGDSINMEDQNEDLQEYGKRMDFEIFYNN